MRAGRKLENGVAGKFDRLQFSVKYNFSLIEKYVMRKSLLIIFLTSIISFTGHKVLLDIPPFDDQFSKISIGIAKFFAFVSN